MSKDLLQSYREQKLVYDEFTTKMAMLVKDLVEASKGITLIDSEGIEFKNVKIMQKEGAALIIHNSKNVNIDNLMVNGSQEDNIVRVSGKDTEAVRFINSSIKLTQVKQSEEVPGNAVILDEVF